VAGEFPRTLYRAALAENAVVLLATAVVVAGGYLAGEVSGQRDLMRDLFYPPTFRFMLGLIWLPLPIAFLVGRLKTFDVEGRYIQGLDGWRENWRRFRTRYLTVPALIRALVAGSAMCVVINVYGSWKRIIPRIAPFTWDARLAEWDRAIHFGHDPWQLLHPLLARPELTAALDTLYSTWHPLLAAMLAWQAWSLRTQSRERFFLATILVWVGLGAVLATLLSSAGPCYYHHLVDGSDRFAPLLQYLGQAGGDAPLLAVRGHEMLWSGYQTGRATPYTGISAMPSLHIAMPALFTAALWERWRLAGAAMALFTLAMLVGSVHLGWHYAIDGYVSILAVAAIWWLLWKPGWRLVSR